MQTEFNFNELMDILKEENEMRQKILAFREQQGKKGIKFSLGGIAAEIGCSLSTISKWLNGERTLGTNLRIRMFMYINRLERTYGVIEYEKEEA